ncbi:hypothetical protein [Herpetosiphon gulosus]|uniref:Uncharacterized protein n=1 Tax=Herpetosiphon gulosus TaxID=1973496 RepID=A0ABP9X2E9_9CHLR
MRWRFTIIILLTSFVLAACGQPQTAQPTTITTITATEKAQSRAQATTQPTVAGTAPPVIQGISADQINGFIAIGELERPLLSRDYVAAENQDIDGDMGYSTMAMMMIYMPDLLAQASDPDPADPYALSMLPIDDYLTQSSVEATIAFYQASFATKGWQAQPVQQQSTDEAALFFEQGQHVVTVLMFVPLHSTELYVMLILSQKPVDAPALTLPLPSNHDIFAANAIPIPPGATLNTNLGNDPLAKSDIHEPQSSLEQFWAGAVEFEGYQILELSSSQEETFDFYETLLVHAGWHNNSRILGQNDHGIPGMGKILLRFVGNDIQVLTLHRMIHTLNQPTDDKWLLAMSLLTLKPTDPTTFNFDPSAFATPNQFVVPTPPEQVEYQVGNDPILDTLIQSWQVELQEKARMQAAGFGIREPLTICNSMPNINYHSFFISQTSPRQLAEFYDQKLAEQGLPLYQPSSDTIRTYYADTGMGKHVVSLVMLDRSSYNQQQSGTLAIIQESTSERRIMFRGEDHYDNQVIDFVTPLSHTLPLMPNSIAYTIGTDESVDDSIQDWLNDLRYESYSDDCEEVTYLDGTTASVFVPQTGNEIVEFYDSIWLGQGWKKFTLEEGHERYTKEEQGGAVLHTINLRWETKLTDLIPNEQLFLLIKIDSNITYR